MKKIILLLCLCFACAPAPKVEINAETSSVKKYNIAGTAKFMYVVTQEFVFFDEEEANAFMEKSLK